MDVLGYILLTVFAVVIVATLMGKVLAPKPPVEEETTEKPRRTEPTPTDVDRFLAEVNRRRREAERQPSQPTPMPARQESRPEPRRERDQERERGSARPTVMRRAPEEPARRLPMVPTVEVVEIPVAPEAPKSTAPRLAARPPSPVLVEVRALLRSPKSVGAAIALQEILGPPLSRRHRTPGLPM